MVPPFLLGIGKSLLGGILGSPLIMGAIAVFIAYNAGYFLGARDATRDMVSKLEIASLEAELANMKAEKKIAEDAAKQAESDRSATDALAAQLARELNEYKAKLAAAGRKCELTPADVCDVYGLHSPQCKNRDKKHRNKSTGLALGLRGDGIAGVDRRCPGRPQAMRQCG